MSNIINGIGLTAGFTAYRRFKAGASSSLRGFEILNAATTVSGTTTYKFRAVLSTLANDLPDAFTAGDDPKWLSDALGSSESGAIWATLTINSSGVITGRSIDYGASVPANTSTAFHLQVGTYASNSSTHAVDVSNIVFGPIPVIICQQNFSSPAVWVVSFFPS